MRAALISLKKSGVRLLARNRTNRLLPRLCRRFSKAVFRHNLTVSNFKNINSSHTLALPLCTARILRPLCKQASISKGDFARMDSQRIIVGKNIQ